MYFCLWRHYYYRKQCSFDEMPCFVTFHLCLHCFLLSNMGFPVWKVFKLSNCISFSLRNNNTDIVDDWQIRFFCCLCNNIPLLSWTISYSSEEFCYGCQRSILWHWRNTGSLYCRIGKFVCQCYSLVTIPSTLYIVRNGLTATCICFLE